MFNIALLQLMPTGTMDENASKGLKACEKAKEIGADLALFPEMWQLGYQRELMTLDYAIGPDNDFIVQFSRKAKELQMAIAITYLGKGKTHPTNNVAIIDNQGTIVLEYAKVHICSFHKGREVMLEGGKEFKVAPLAFAGGRVKIGAMICFDREFPESARTLMLKGAEIIITPNSCPLHNCPVLGDVRLHQFRARAFENMVGIALANYPVPKNDGHSCAFDVDGKQIVMADEQEGIFMAKFNVDAIRAWQQKEVWGGAFRRVDAYEV